jgi:hypothetical protein
MSSPVLRTRVPESLRERVQVAAETRSVTVSRFLRDALADRVHAVETIEASALRARARKMADELRAQGDDRPADLIDGLLLDLATKDAMYGPVVC